jgi:tetratricopeptide (TPR) repeat protein
MADRQLSKAVHFGATSTDGYRALADIAERRGDLNGAARYYDMVCKLEPSAVRLHYKAALLSIDSGDLEKAYHHTLKARDLHFQPKPQSDVDSEDLKELMDEVTTACIRAARIDLSRVKNSRQVYEKMVWLNRAKELQPDSDVYLEMARYHERLGDLAGGERKGNCYDQAVTCLQEAKKLSPRSPAVQTVLNRCLAKRSKAGY